jgi:hypothetical protein
MRCHLDGSRVRRVCGDDDGFLPRLFHNGTARVLIARDECCKELKNRRRAGGVVLATSPVVIWFYERRGEHLRCEINQQIEGDRFALIVTLPDGTERIEMFEDSGALNRRSVELEKMLREKGWNGPFARDI